MAYIIGIVTEEEEIELGRRGWEAEVPPAELVDDKLQPLSGSRFRMYWVSSSVFDLMTGPGWQQGWVRPPCKVCGREYSDHAEPEEPMEERTKCLFGPGEYTP